MPYQNNNPEGDNWNKERNQAQQDCTRNVCLPSEATNLYSRT